MNSENRKKRPANSKSSGQRAPSARQEGDSEPASAANFEVGLHQLELIIQQLEQGELGLDEALQHYEQGIACLRQCQAALDHAEARIDQLFRIDEEGQAQVKPFEHRQALADDKDT